MAIPIESYKYQRNCSLQSCSKLFGTNYKRQLFCKDPHRIIYHEMKRRKTALLYKRMSKLEKDLKQIYMGLDQTIKKAAKEAGRMADLLSPKRGGENSTDTTKTKR